MLNMQASELVAVVGAIDPDAYTANTFTSGWISAADFHTFMGVVMAGDIGVSASVTGKITAATDASGSNPTDISGAATTALTGSGGDGNKQAVVSFRQADLGDYAEGTPFTHFRLAITLGDDGSSPSGTAGDLAGVVLGVSPRVAPASDHDATTVDSVTVV